MAIHLLVPELLCLIGNTIPRCNFTSIVSLYRDVALTLQHVQFIVLGLDDACWSIWRRSVDHKIRDISWFGFQICVVYRKWLARRIYIISLHSYGALALDNIAVSFNRHQPSALRAHQYLHLPISGYGDVMGDALQVMFVSSCEFVWISINVWYGNSGSDGIDRHSSK